MTKSSILALVLALGLGTAAHAAVPAVTALDAITAVERQSGGTVIELDLRDQGSTPTYHVQAISNGGKLDFLVDGVTGKVRPMSGSEAAATTDTTEAEGPNDADSGNEDTD